MIVVTYEVNKIIAYSCIDNICNRSGSKASYLLMHGSWMCMYYKENISLRFSIYSECFCEHKQMTMELVYLTDLFNEETFLRRKIFQNILKQ